MMFYATPILYSMEFFKGTFIGSLIQLNPMTTIINCYRDILYWGSMPHILSLLVVMAGSLILCFIGLNVFRKFSKGNKRPIA